MSKILILISMFVSASAFAGIGPVEYGVEALVAANLMRQPGVNKCLNQFERGGAIAYVLEITEVNTADEQKFLLSGTSISGDILMGSWEVTVNVEQLEEETRYTCTIDKNEE